LEFGRPEHLREFRNSGVTTSKTSVLAASDRSIVSALR
jgi:hypothetical protein